MVTRSRGDFLQIIVNASTSCLLSTQTGAIMPVKVNHATNDHFQYNFN